MSSAVTLNEHRPEKKNLTHFAVAASRAGGVELLREFKEIVLRGDAKELNEWFSRKGYEITFDECETIIWNKDNLPEFKNNIVNADY